MLSKADHCGLQLRNKWDSHLPSDKFTPCTIKIRCGAALCEPPRFSRKSLRQIHSITMSNGLDPCGCNQAKMPEKQGRPVDVRQRHGDAKRVGRAESVTEYAAAYSAALFACNPRWFARSLTRKDIFHTQLRTTCSTARLIWLKTNDACRDTDVHWHSSSALMCT